MSDPAKYRTKEEVDKYRNERDPIDHVRKLLLDGKMTDETALKAVDAEIRKIVNDPAVEVARSSRNTRPGAPPSRIDSDAFTAIESAVTTHYGKVTTLPTMSTGATDMAFLRAKGMQCYGVGPLTDSEDGPKGFGAHSDQERILESSLHTFVKFHWDIVVRVAGAPRS